jgi:hypothetical protein
MPLFVWTEWPDIYTPAEYATYFRRLLKFIDGNCGSFRTTKVILRVTDPNIVDLFEVSTTSALYTDFISSLPASVELHLYPYVYDARAQSAWSSNGKPLEGVFAYAKKWNDLLSSERFVGIVLDGEEKAGFQSEMSNVPQYKSAYGVGSLGIAIGYDATGQMSSYSQADAFYLEMYDFYVNDAPKLTLVQTGPTETDPQTFLDVLSRDVLGPHLGKYTDSKLHFMWSIQAKSKTDCLYPLSGKCGSSDDFGWFSAPNFNRFLQLLASKYPVFAGRDHGIFQFSFLPASWL